MGKNIDDFDGFYQNKHRREHIIYTEKELKSVIKTMANKHLKESIKNIKIDLSEEYIEIESKHRYNHLNKSVIDSNKKLIKWVYENENFYDYLKNILGYKYTSPQIKVELRDKWDDVLHIYFNEWV